MSKLFITCCSLCAGGAERVLSVLSKPLAEHYDEVQYIMWYDKPVFYDFDPKVKIISVEKHVGKWNVLKCMQWFRKYINHEQPDLVLSMSAPFNMLTLGSLLFSHHKIVVAERVDPRSFHWGKHLEIARNILYKKATGILAQTEYSKSYFKKDLYKKTDVIFNPIIMSSDLIGSALGTKKNHTIATAGRLTYQKRHDLLIKVFAKFHKSHPEYKLIIYGEGQERENLESLIVELDVKNAVALPGATKNLWQELTTANMFIMTSLFEGMSNSLIEAMCLGLPCISTKVSGAIDLIKSDQNGILIDINDESALYDAMIKIAENKDFAYKLANNATKLYDILNVETISNQWIDYIDRMIKK